MSDDLRTIKASILATSDEDQKQIVDSVLAVNPDFIPQSSRDRARLWLTLIIGVLAVAVLAMAAAVILTVLGRADNAAAAWPIATAALGGLLGLFAKSPTS